MFEKIVRKKSEEISKNSGNKKFYLLTHKKNYREIYFCNNSEAIKFIKIKFNSPLKLITYYLIKMRILQFFLKTVYLPKEAGEVIFVAGHIKCFDLKNKKVFSFTKDKKDDKNLVKYKRMQKKIAKEKFAPEVFKINERVPYTIEELASSNIEINELKIFKTLLSFYKSRKIEKIPFDKYIISLKHSLKKPNQVPKDKLKRITSILDKLLKDQRAKNIKMIIVESHGDFDKTQIVEKDGRYLFVDWHNERAPIISDLVRYFRNEKNLFRNEKFMKSLELYPSEVQSNLKNYIVINEIYESIKRGPRSNYLK